MPARSPRRTATATRSRSCTPAGMTCTSLWLTGATALLAGARDAWHGTVLAIFQPAEETAQGARAMIDDGLFRSLAQARGHPRPARHARTCRTHRLPARHHPG